MLGVRADGAPLAVASQQQACKLQIGSREMQGVPCRSLILLAEAAGQASGRRSTESGKMDTCEAVPLLGPPGCGGCAAQQSVAKRYSLFSLSMHFHSTASNRCQGKASLEGAGGRPCRACNGCVGMPGPRACWRKLSSACRWHATASDVLCWRMCYGAGSGYRRIRAARGPCRSLLCRAALLLRDGSWHRDSRIASELQSASLCRLGVGREA